jgi:hypothetical protein
MQALAEEYQTTAPNPAAVQSAGYCVAADQMDNATGWSNSYEGALETLVAVGISEPQAQAWVAERAETIGAYTYAAKSYETLDRNEDAVRALLKLHRARLADCLIDELDQYTLGECWVTDQHLEIFKDITSLLQR